MKRFTLILLCIPLLASVSFAQGPFRIACGEYAPYYSKSLDQFGQVPSTATPVLNSIGLEVEYGWFPWARAYNHVKDGSWDASFTGAKTPERQKHFLYSDPVRSNQIVFYHLKSKEFIWNKISDLAHYRIGGTIGYAYSKSFMKAEGDRVITVDWTETDILNFKKLLAGRIDIFPISKDVGMTKLNKHFTAEQISLLEVSGKPLVSNDVHLILSNKKPENRVLLEQFNAALNEYKNK